ncbi:D-serine dehydratase [Teratosphaeria destructans]|uniref:D-serine dehydratase n=1 Tax=Teratosphaeria destructans TaxID=418781 RepID=A0A9W7SZX8_9PEZI|nr:D-serine dehydratase [Teratosphaeria destructans]
MDTCRKVQELLTHRTASDKYWLARGKSSKSYHQVRFFLRLQQLLCLHTSQSTTQDPIPAPSLHPTSSAAGLKLHSVGKKLQDVQAPAVVLDAAVIKRNCKLLLDAARSLDIGFHAHVKTHKTTEITKLQVGEGQTAVKLVASTISEIENLLPWLLECKAHGRNVDIAYGIPIAPSFIPRLASVARVLGPDSIGVFVDHPDHIKLFDDVPEEQ